MIVCIFENGLPFSQSLNCDLKEFVVWFPLVDNIRITAFISVSSLSSRNSWNLTYLLRMSCPCVWISEKLWIQTLKLISLYNLKLVIFNCCSWNHHYIMFVFILHSVGLWYHTLTHHGTVLLHKHLVSATVLQADRFEQYTVVFPEDALSRTLKVYPVLSGSKLKTELSLIYCKEEFRSYRGAVDLLQLFMENNLEEVFSETVTLLKILISTHMTTAEVIWELLLNLEKNEDFSEKQQDPGEAECIVHAVTGEETGTEMTDFNQKEHQGEICKPERKESKIYFQIVLLASD